MVTLRCTQKLLKFLGIVPAKTLELTTAALGDWYANLVPTESGDLIVFVNERSLLTVAVTVWESKHLVSLFCLRVFNLLGMIGIDPGEIVNEINHFDRVQFGKTVSRSVLGSMNDIAWQYQVRAEAARDKTDLSLSEAEASLSQMPCKPIGYKVPAEVAKELLEPKRKNVS